MNSSDATSPNANNTNAEGTAPTKLAADEHLHIDNEGSLAPSFEPSFEALTINSQQRPIVIVGAGLAGLVAANALSASGRSSIVLDKGASVGGRLATRRLKGAGGVTARADHGAQFFTVRSPDFAELVHDWRRVGIVREWCRGFSGAQDGYPRYCAEAGMNTIAKYLAASADVECNVHLRSIAGADGLLSVATEDGRRWESDTVIVTAPVQQSLDLCSNGWLPIPEEVEAALKLVSYASCLALLVSFEGSALLGEPGGVQLSVDDDSVFSFVADNQLKGISDVGALTLHVNDSVSSERYDLDDDDTCTYLLAEAKRFLGDALPLDVQLKKWRYARPLVGHPDTCVSVAPIEGTQLIFAGDAFGGAKVEGAALSGLAAAQAVLAVLAGSS
jgi:renalase